MSDEFALEAMLRFESLGIGAVEIGRAVLLRSLVLAREHGLTMYGATYLAVSEATDAPLLTLDEGLERAAAAMGLDRDGGTTQVSERPAAYQDGPVDLTSLAAIGAAIAEMRRQDAS
jgi:hypothetical protein